MQQSTKDSKHAAYTDAADFASQGLEYGRKGDSVLAQAGCESAHAEGGANPVLKDTNDTRGHQTILGVNSTSVGKARPASHAAPWKSTLARRKGAGGAHLGDTGCE
jgi:hypothetical protein